ncbi:MAG: beta-ketoacyl-[acyl-carrier-protein] synthase family protein, partial [Chloroflexota bacterium]
MALEDSRLNISPVNEDRVGVVMGTAVGSAYFFERAHELVMAGNPGQVSSFFLVNASANVVSGIVAQQLRARGVNHFLQEACATGTNVIGMGVHLIRLGLADAIIAGGCEASISPTFWAGIEAVGAATSKKYPHPHQASRPFDRERDGLVTGEGGGAVVLEALEVAQRREAKIYGEVLGYGSNNDAHHFTSPSPQGEGAARCMRFALEDARISASEVDYINAHGTSTVLNDLAETQAIKRTFAEHARKLAVSSNKSALGHTWGAAGALEAIFSLFTIRDSLIPPTLNYEFPDPECDLDYVPNEARRARVRTVLSNSFGFGGINGSLVLREFTP